MDDCGVGCGLEKERTSQEVDKRQKPTAPPAAQPRSPLLLFRCAKCRTLCTPVTGHSSLQSTGEWPAKRASRLTTHAPDQRAIRVEVGSCTKCPGRQADDATRKKSTAGRVSGWSGTVKMQCGFLVHASCADEGTHWRFSAPRRRTTSAASLATTTSRQKQRQIQPSSFTVTVSPSDEAIQVPRFQKLVWPHHPS